MHYIFPNITIIMLAGLATTTVVNSHFTAGVFCDTFKSISRRPEVLYPSLNFESFDRECAFNLNSVIKTVRSIDFIYLSINRYERKKNLGLAINAFGNNMNILFISLY